MVNIIKEVAKRLEDAGIAYMFTGSTALNFYAVPRMTRDVDIVIELYQGDAEKIYGLFENDFYIDMAMITDAIKRHGMFNIIHFESIFKVDFIIRKDSPYRIEEMNLPAASSRVSEEKPLFQKTLLYPVASYRE